MSNPNVTANTKKWDELRARAYKLDRAYVKVGVLEKDNVSRGTDEMTLVEIATVHEFGSSDGRIPARSFIRGTFLIRRVNALATFQTKLCKAIVMDGLDPYKALEMLGAWGVAEVKNTFTEIDIPPPLADSTIMRKGSSKPLIDSGLLKNSISSEVVTNAAATEEQSRTEMPRGR